MNVPTTATAKMAGAGSSNDAIRITVSSVPFVVRGDIPVAELISVVSVLSLTNNVIGTKGGVL